MAAPSTRYVKSDDVHIAYQVIGDGPLDLVFVPGFVSHVVQASERTSLADVVNFPRGRSTVARSSVLASRHLAADVRCDALGGCTHSVLG